MPIRKIVLIQPRPDGRFLGRGISEPYTLMRLASIVDPPDPGRNLGRRSDGVADPPARPQDLVGNQREKRS